MPDLCPVCGNGIDDLFWIVPLEVISSLLTSEVKDTKVCCECGMKRLELIKSRVFQIVV